MVDESVWGPDDAGRVIEARAADIINVYVSEAGGLRNAAQIFAMAEAAGIVCTIGSMPELGIGTAAQMHLAVAMPHLLGPSDVCGVVYNAETLINEILPIGEGLAGIPLGPGLGVSLDEARLKHSHVNTRSKRENEHAHEPKASNVVGRRRLSDLCTRVRSRRAAGARARPKPDDRQDQEGRHVAGRRGDRLAVARARPEVRQVHRSDRGSRGEARPDSRRQARVHPIGLGRHRRRRAGQAVRACPRALFASPKRMAVIDFANYAEGGTCYAVLKTNTKVKALDDLNKPDVVTGTFTGTGTEQEFVKKYPKGKVNSVAQAPGGGTRVLEVINGRIDTAAFNSPLRWPSKRSSRRSASFPVPRSVSLTPIFPFRSAPVLPRATRPSAKFVAEVVEKMKPEMQKTIEKYSTLEFPPGSVGLVSGSRGRTGHLSGRDRGR